jgi:PhzF family phenazine biosynthesis protein
MKQKIYQIDTFTNKTFRGNPAMVCPLDGWLSDETMQQIAQENNLSETAFFVKEDEVYNLRWFTPISEVDMCGHATLASAYVLFECMGHDKNEVISFFTKSGILKVWKEDSRYVMDFPIQAIKSCDISEQIEVSFGIKPIAIFASMDYIIVFEYEEDVLNAKPNLTLLKELDLRAVCITAKSKEYDFVTRFFAPKIGVNEDPVTGSAFTQLVSYWADVLEKNELSAKQVSKRGGEIRCSIKDGRVEISGDGVKYLEGFIEV